MHQISDHADHMGHSPDSAPSLAAMAIMSIAYDIDVKSLHDPYVLTAEAAVKPITETTNAGSYLVDVLPVCEYGWTPFSR